MGTDPKELYPLDIEYWITSFGAYRPKARALQDSSRKEPSSVSALQCEPLDGKVAPARQTSWGGLRDTECSRKEAFLPLLPPSCWNISLRQTWLWQDRFGPCPGSCSLSHHNIPWLSSHVVIIKAIQHPGPWECFVWFWENHTREWGGDHL